MKKGSIILLCVVLAVVAAVAVFLPEQTPATPNGPAKVVVADKLIDVPAICQYPTLPTGCESVAATMVLHYYGDTVPPEDFAEDWLPRSDAFYQRDGKLYGPDPREVFVGDPFRTASYGCFAQPIVRAVNGNSTVCTAEKITGRSLPALCAEYVDKDKPLLIWATMEMAEPKEGNRWYLEDGTSFTWPAGEHCLVLVGYNAGHYFLNDPMTGSTVGYEKETVEQRFAALGSQAVYIHK